jgi:hypothetical protein
MGTTDVGGGISGWYNMVCGRYSSSYTTPSSWTWCGLLLDASVQHDGPHRVYCLCYDVVPFRECIGERLVTRSQGWSKRRCGLEMVSWAPNLIMVIETPPVILRHSCQVLLVCLQQHDVERFWPVLPRGDCLLASVEGGRYAQVSRSSPHHLIIPAQVV